jgi:hypothetical protein
VYKKSTATKVASHDTFIDFENLRATLSTFWWNSSHRILAYIYNDRERQMVFPHWITACTIFWDLTGNREISQKACTWHTHEVLIQRRLGSLLIHRVVLSHVSLMLQRITLPLLSCFFLFHSGPSDVFRSEPVPYDPCSSTSIPYFSSVSSAFARSLDFSSAVISSALHSRW